MTQAPTSPPPMSPREPDPFSRSALLCVVLGVVEVALSGCCSTGLALLASGAVPLSELAAQQPMSPEQAEALAKWEQVSPGVRWAMVAGVVGLGVVPGLTLVAMSWSIRRARAWALVTAMVITVAQAIMLGIVLAQAVIGSLMLGQPGALVLNVLTLGTPLGLTLMAVNWLFKARRAQVRGWVIEMRRMQREALGLARSAGGEQRQGPVEEPWDAPDYNARNRDRDGDRGR